jgi:hypothetical protein
MKSVPFIDKKGPVTNESHLPPSGQVLENVGVDTIDAPSSKLHVCCAPVNEYATVPFVEEIDPLKVDGLKESPGYAGGDHVDDDV